MPPEASGGIIRIEEKMKTKVWAHRGASDYAPENTLEAFALAVKQGADGVELDVQMTKDGKLVVAHDETVDRVSDGKGRIVDYTLAELKEFCFNKTRPEYPNVRIPTLKEAYELLEPTGLTVNVELKTGIVIYQGIEEAALRMAKKMGMEERVIYSSFYHKSLVQLMRMEPKVKTGILYSDGWMDVPQYAEKLGATAIHPALYHLQSEKLLVQARKRDLPVHVWTVNQKEHMEQLAKMKVSAIITNRPDVCRKVVDSIEQLR